MGSYARLFLALVVSASVARAGEVERAARFAMLEDAQEPAASATRGAPSGVADEIRAFNAPRAANPEYLKEKLLRIASGPWSFLRGTAHLFYRRIAADPSGLTPFITPASSKVVIHGDFHMQNCGTFEDGRGKVRYDVQDFDDSTRGPYVLDVLRAATSTLIMAEDAQVSASDARDATHALLEEYVDAVDDAAAGRLDPDFSFKEDDAKGPIAAVIARAKQVTRKEHLKSRCKDRRFRRGEKFFDVSEDLAASIGSAVAGKKKVHDVARKKSSGCGSLGLDNFVVLVETSGNPDEDVILELKEQITPSPVAYLPAIMGSAPAALAADPAVRAVTAQRVLQSNPDRWIDAVKIGRKSFLVREDSPAKDGLVSTDIGSAKDLEHAAKAVARLAAKAHTRQFGGAAAAIRKAIGEKKAFVDALAALADVQAKGVHADYREYLKSPLARGEW